MAELTTKQYLDLAGLQSYDAKAKARTEAAIKVVDGKVAENAADITTLDKAVQENAGKIAENTANININKQAIADNKTAADTGIQEAKNAAKAAQDDVDALEAKVGEVPTDKTVVQMIADAQQAATYDDTQVKADIKANADAIAAEVLRADAAEKANKALIDANLGEINAIKADYLKAADKTELNNAITAEADRAKAAEKVNADAIAAINNPDTGILKQSKDYTDTTVAAAVEDVKSSLASALTYKGQKATVSELPTEGNKCGDVWSVATTDKGTSAEFVWVVDDEEAGTGHWEELGTAVDLSGYATKQQVATDIATAKGEAIAAAATDAKTKADKALADAKDYADGLAGNYEVAGAAAAAESNAKTYTDTEVQSVYAAIERIPDADIEELFA